MLLCTYVWIWPGWMYIIYVPYLSILKPGSNIRWVMQWNERNKRLGPFKRRVPKLLNLINLTMAPNVKEN